MVLFSEPLLGNNAAKFQYPKLRSIRLTGRRDYWRVLCSCLRILSEAAEKGMFPRFLIVFVLGFGVGALTIVGAGAVGLYLIINRLNQKTKQNEARIAAQSKESSGELDPYESLEFAQNKQGVVWFLDSEKIPRNSPDKGTKEQKRKKDVLEVSPIKKHARIKNKKLILTEPDGSHTAIELKGCIVEAVSATNSSSRKWAKRFPLKLDCKTSAIPNGNKTFYIYLETSWEKESWCKALRLASCIAKDRGDWFAKLHKEFHSYLKTLNTGYPSFMKPSIGFCTEPADRTTRPDGTSSRVRQFLKKFAKKTSRVGLENKSSGPSLSGRAERKANDNMCPPQETVSASGLVKRSKSEENMVQQSAFVFPHSGSQTNSSTIDDADSDDKWGNDEGALCLNLLISRLFFDLKSNKEIKRSMQSRVQRTLSSTRTPSYIGELICTGIDPGNLPPHIHGMRMLPIDMNEVWALEVDIEYSGGVVLDIETRLEVRELDAQKGIVDSDLGSSSVGDFPSDLLEDFEDFGKQLNPAGDTVDAPQRKEEDGLKSSKTSVSGSAYGSRWKSILNSIAKQVSQVPLSLVIRMTSLRGTLRLHIKPPPSDQLWLAFTSMPDIDFNLESSIGEHKINSGHIALFLISRLKAAIRETLVLPNCESLSIPWMMAEKDDWVPKKVAPFVWLRQEVINDPTAEHDIPMSQPTEAETKTQASSETASFLESKHKNPSNAESICEESDELETSTSGDLSADKSRSLQELQTPLLGNDEPQETCNQVEEASDCRSLSRSVILFEKPDSTMEEDDLKPKRMGRRARMLDIGKKMSEKLEEKRRHIEEKGRNIVEKMRGP